MNMPLVLLNRRRRGGSFSPYSLFSGTAIGTWFDPSDLSTMYQDAAGTTAVTTPGQPVGLRLDKSKGLVLGAELVGGVWSGTGNAQDGTVFSGDDLEYWATEFPTVIGRSYRFTATLSGKVNNSQIRFRAGISGTGTALYSSNNDALPLTVNILVVATSTTSNIEILFRSASASVTLSNISVRELAGNHATQSVLASRPVYGIEPAGGRRNLLTYSEDYSNVIWSKARASISNLTTITATETNASGSWVGQTATGAVGTQVFSSIISKNTGYVMLTAGSSALNTDNVRVWFDTDAGTIGTSEANGTGFSVVSTSVADAGANWRVAVVYSATTAAQFQRFYLVNANSSLSVTIGRSASFPGAQLELGSTVTPYQRVTRAEDVTEAGVQSCHYVQYDGINHGMITNAIDFTATDKMSVFAGVRKLSDAVFSAIFLELSATNGTNNGVFTVAAPPSSADRYYFASKGTILGAANTVGYAAPITNVLTGLGDIAGDLATLRIDGTQVAQATTDQGTGNYGNYKLNIGRRGNDQTTPTLPFYGRDYGIVVVGKATTAAEITSTERWLSGKTGFYAPIITGVPTIGVS